MKRILQIVMCAILVSQATVTLAIEFRWKRVRSAAETATLPVTYSPSAIDRTNGIAYVLARLSTGKELFAVDLASGLVVKIDTKGNLPDRIDMYTYDPIGQRIVAGRSGRDRLFALSVNGDRTWTNSYGGTLDNESYGTNLFWNTKSNRPAMFSGYGFFRLKNWVWEATASGWQNVVPDNEQCKSSRRTNQDRMILGAPESNEVFFYSGEGSCSGVQFDGERSCANGKPWSTSEPNSYCWLRDIWRYDFEAHQFVNVLPASTKTYDMEGIMSYDYIDKVFVMLPLFEPMNIDEDAATPSLSALQILKLGETEFTRVSVGGDVPPNVSMKELRNMIMYYDARYERFVMMRGDGIWHLEKGSGVPTECRNQQLIDSAAIDVRKGFTWTSPVLERGREYVLRGYGQWKAAGTPNRQEDFIYTYSLPCNISGSNNHPGNWVRVGFNIDSMLVGKGLLTPLESGLNCESHRYTYRVIGEGQRLVVDFRDNPYGDNTGSLSFAFYGCGATKNSTCVSRMPVDSTVLNTRQNVTWKSVPTKAGVIYTLVGSGVWRWNISDTQQADFRYYITPPCDSATASQSMFIGVGLDEEATKRRMGLLIPTSSQVNCSDHVYEYQFVGNGNPVVVDFFDNYTADNSGSINVRLDECLSCPVSQPADSILGYRVIETHQVVTYALRNTPGVSYQWIATGGYLLGETTKHYCDVIWGFDPTGSVCCIVSDSTCSDTICMTTVIEDEKTLGVRTSDDVVRLVVRPNPASDALEVESTHAGLGSSYELIDMTGRIVLSTEGQTARMSLVGIADGVYHILHRDVTGRVVCMERVVVRR